MLARLSASGPTSAIVPARASGSTPSFFSSTQDLRRRLARQPAVAGGEGDRLPALFVQAAIGLGEQAELLLGAQHAAAGGVDVGFGDAALGHERRQMAHVAFAHQVDIDASGEGEQRRLLLVGGDAVMHELHDRGVVGDDEALEAPLPAQQVVQQFAMRGAGNAGEIMKADHDGADIRLDRRLERRQHHVVHAVGRGIDRVVVAAGLRRSHSRRNAWRRPSPRRARARSPP